MEFACSRKASRFFRLEKRGGTYSCGNPDTYYLDGSEPQEASFDFGNNMVIGNMTPYGELRELVFFDGCHYADHIPGVWVHKEAFRGGPYRFPVAVADTGSNAASAADAAGMSTAGTADDESEKDRITDSRWKDNYRMDLMECVLPLSSHSICGTDICLTAFAPLSKDGKTRLRGAFYLLSVKNKNKTPKEVTIALPFSVGYQEIDDGNARLDLCFVDKEGRPQKGRPEKLCARLQPGEDYEAYVRITVYGEDTSQWEKGVLFWLKETLAYYENGFGELELKAYPVLGELLKRSICQCQQCIGMDGGGELAGSSWGTAPLTSQVWMRDMYYSMLPLAFFDPKLFEKGIRWFAAYGVRPKGMRFEGGVIHSLANSVNAVVMAGLYYRQTGNGGFFLEDSALMERLEQIMEEVLESRKDRNCFLFPSIWLSDGLCMGDYHTGSNIAAWFAFSSLARILKEVMGEEEKAGRYGYVAERTRECILEQCVTDGPFGKQFTEGIGDGPEWLRREMQADSLEEFEQKQKGFGVQLYEFFNRHSAGETYPVHDGEETDTTLSSFYGLLPSGSEVVKNNARFALSPHNRFYNEVTEGILWENCSDATFPGYVTGLACMEWGERNDRYLNPFLRLIDVDGSIWWWPYGHKAAERRTVQREPGKSGWASGAFAAVFLHDIMGLTYDGARRTLTVAQPERAGSYEWKNARFGNCRLHLRLEESGYYVANCGKEALRVEICLTGQPERKAQLGAGEEFYCQRV